MRRVNQTWRCSRAGSHVAIENITGVSCAGCGCRLIRSTVRTIANAVFPEPGSPRITSRLVGSALYMAANWLIEPCLGEASLLPFLSAADNLPTTGLAVVVHC